MGLLQTRKFVHFPIRIHTDNFLLLVSTDTKQIYSGSSLVNFVWGYEIKQQKAENWGSVSRQ